MGKYFIPSRLKGVIYHFPLAISDDGTEIRCGTNGIKHIVSECIANGQYSGNYICTSYTCRNEPELEMMRASHVLWLSVKLNKVG